MACHVKCHLRNEIHQCQQPCLSFAAQTCCSAQRLNKKCSAVILDKSHTNHTFFMSLASLHTSTPYLNLLHSCLDGALSKHVPSTCLLLSVCSCMCVSTCPRVSFCESVTQRNSDTISGHGYSIINISQCHFCDKNKAVLLICF